MMNLAVRCRARFPVEIQVEASRTDPRAGEVVEKARAGVRLGAATRKRAGSRLWLAFARYKEFAAYCVIASGGRGQSGKQGATAGSRGSAVDRGQGVNRMGRDQSDRGRDRQSMSWTLYESRHLRRAQDNKTFDWARPIRSRFGRSGGTRRRAYFINRPGKKTLLGAGETGQGPAAGIRSQNAIANANGKRLRHLPRTRRRIKDLRSTREASGTPFGFPTTPLQVVAAASRQKQQRGFVVHH